MPLSLIYCKVNNVFIRTEKTYFQSKVSQSKQIEIQKTEKLSTYSLDELRSVHHLAARLHTNVCCYVNGFTACINLIPALSLVCEKS